MAKSKVTKLKKGALDINAIRGIINKKAGREVAHSLQNNNPTEVNEWIPTGSRWLDAIICKGRPQGFLWARFQKSQDSQVLVNHS